MEQVLEVPVRHSHNYTLYTSFTGLVNDHLQGRDKNLTAFQTKAFLWRPFASKKILKPRTMNQVHHKNTLIVSFTLLNKKNKKI